MKREILFYVKKELAYGKFRYVLESSLNSGKFWFNTLPKQKHGDGIEYHESFDGKLSELIYRGKLSIGEYEMKVFYNQEYKTIGSCFVGENRNKSHHYNTEDVIDIFPLNEQEILHFMNLFRNYGN